METVDQIESLLSKLNSHLLVSLYFYPYYYPNIISGAGLWSA